MADISKRDKLERCVGALRTERASFISHYQSLAEFVRPRRGRFQTSDRNKGDRRFSNIINSVATRAHKIAMAGMFNGIMSPSRPWLALETDEAALMEYSPVKEWFYAAQETMRRIFNASNLYNAAPVMIGEQLLFGTGCLAHEDDPRLMSLFRAHTAGSYMLSQNDRFEVDTVGREYEMTVEQIVKRFSVTPRDINKNISIAVRTQWDRGNYYAWYPVTQFVALNDEYNQGSLRPLERPFRSTYYEPGNRAKDLLEEQGFHEFPFYCPRWEVTGEDVYGTDCPGMTALGDVRQVQSMERDGAQGLKKMVSPVLQGPVSMRNVQFRNLPGQMNITDTMGDQKGIRSAYDVKLPFGELLQGIERVERRINDSFHVDLFRAITDMQGIQPKNQLELTQRDQERLLQLGPVLQRQFNEFLDKLVDRQFNQMVRASMNARGEWLDNGVLPPPPPELQGRPIRPRYTGVLAMAQQVSQVGTVDRLAGFVGGLVSYGFQSAMDKFDADQSVDEMARLIGAPPNLVVPDEVVAKQREQRQQQEQAQQAMEAGNQLATMAKTAGEATNAQQGP